MKYKYGDLYFRYGDLYPDTFPEVVSIDAEERERMLKIREMMMDNSESLRKSLSSMDGNYIIGDDLNECLRYNFSETHTFKKYLAENHLLFKTKEACQMVMDKMKEVL